MDEVVFWILKPPSASSFLARCAQVKLLTSGKSLFYCLVPNRMGKMRAVTGSTLSMPHSQQLCISWEYRDSLRRKGYTTSRVWFLVCTVLDVFVSCYLLGQWITKQSHLSCMVIILNFQNEAIVYLNSKFSADPEVPNSRQEIACFLSCLPDCFLRRNLESL